MSDPYTILPEVEEFAEMTRIEAVLHLRSFHQVWFTSNEPIEAMTSHHQEQHQGAEMTRGHVPHRHGGS